MQVADLQSLAERGPHRRVAGAVGRAPSHDEQVAGVRADFDFRRRNRRVVGDVVDLLRAKYLVDAEGYNKIQGKPFKQSEIEAKIEEVTR